MNETLSFYKCEICGTLVEVVTDGAGELVCCNQPMTKLEKNTDEPQFGEHHLPVINETEEYKKITIGKTPHPMTNEHYIEFIEVYSKYGKKLYRQYLEPGSEPEIKVPKCFDIGRAAAYCNIHGLWETSNNS